jgi:hypothetical protein
MKRKRRKMETASHDFDDLARYNSERARGIMHTPEWTARMASLQEEWIEAWRHDHPDMNVVAPKGERL